MKIKLRYLFLTSLILFTSFGCSNTSSNKSSEYFTYHDVDYQKVHYDEERDVSSLYQNINIKPLDNSFNDEFAYGVDISSYEMVNKEERKYFDKTGTRRDFFEILKESGVNFIRLRLWNDPTYMGHSFGAGDNDILTDIKIAKKAQRVGLNILLDFHYSDFWADPGKQTIPRAWKDKMDLTNEVYDFTYKSLMSFKNEGINISAVQIGNEINNGLLWPNYKLDFDHYDESLKNISKVLESGIKASKSAFKEIKTIVHLANATNENEFIKFNKALIANDVNFDIIGASYYPFYQYNLNALESTFKRCVKEFNKPVMLLETSYAYTLKEEEYCSNLFTKESEITSGYQASIQGQITALNEIFTILSRIPNKMCLGFFYWEPSMLNAPHVNVGSKYADMYTRDLDDISSAHEYKNSWCNQALFLTSGEALPSLYLYQYLQNDVLKVEETFDHQYEEIYLRFNDDLPTRIKGVSNYGKISSYQVSYLDIDLNDFTEEKEYVIPCLINDKYKTSIKVYFTHNLLLNPGFERYDHSWTLSNCYIKNYQSYEGDNALNFYTAKEEDLFSATQRVYVTKGTYALSAYGLGDNHLNNRFISLTMNVKGNDLNKSLDIRGYFKGFFNTNKDKDNYSYMKLDNIKVLHDSYIDISFEGTLKNQAWGFIDSVKLVKTN